MKANLPTEKAQEPQEGAHQPLYEGNMSSRARANSSAATNRENLSQPTPYLTHREKLLWLQKRRTSGLWAQCEDCLRWRYLPSVLDKTELPKKWTCSMNPDDSMANCSIPEAPIRVSDEEDLIHSDFSCGSIVWARMAGWPWWPAMVDDCPDTEQFYWLDGFSDIPTHYHVSFFDDGDVTRAWIEAKNIKSYDCNKEIYKYLLTSNKYRRRLNTAMAQADDANSLSLENRLDKYSFLSRYTGPIRTPRKINKNILKKHQDNLKRKYNIEFPNESPNSSETENENVSRNEAAKNANVIIIGSQKNNYLHSDIENGAVEKTLTPNKSSENIVYTQDEIKERDKNVTPVLTQINTNQEMITGNETESAVASEILNNCDPNTSGSEDFDFTDEF